MARRRVIDPEFFLDEELAVLSPHSRLLYIGCWTIADDRAFSLPYRPNWIKAQLFPYEDIDIDKCIKELIKLNKFMVFENTNPNKQFIFIPNMAKYQRIDRPSQQKYPFHPDFDKITQRVFHEVSRTKLSKVNISKENINIVEKVIGYFNQKTGKQYRTNSSENRVNITARLKDGYTEADLCKVIDNMTDKWLGDEKMEQFLRPKTLFRPSHFEDYLNIDKGPASKAKEIMKGLKGGK